MATDLIVTTSRRDPNVTATVREGRGLFSLSFQELQHRSSVPIAVGEPVHPDVEVEFKLADQPEIVEPVDVV